MANPEVTGLDDFLKYLFDAPAVMKLTVHGGIGAGAALIEAHAKANCPEASGELASTIHAVITDTKAGVNASIKAGGTAPDGTQVNYAHLIEFSGAAPHVIKAHGKGLAFDGATFPEVHHPGMKAHPFLRPALDANEVAAVGMLDQAIGAMLKLN